MATVEPVEHCVVADGVYSSQLALASLRALRAGSGALVGLYLDVRMCVRSAGRAVCGYLCVCVCVCVCVLGALVGLYVIVCAYVCVTAQLCTQAYVDTCLATPILCATAVDKTTSEPHYAYAHTYIHVPYAHMHTYISVTHAHMHTYLSRKSDIVCHGCR